MAIVSRVFLAALCGVAFLISGCQAPAFQPAQGEWGAPTSNDAILVIGHIDMSEVSAALGRMDIERIAPSEDYFENRFRQIRNGDNYTFFTEALTPGQYQFQGFRGRSGADDHWFDIHENPRFLRSFPAAGVYYIGSYKLKKIAPDGQRGAARYELAPVPGPSERDLLLQIRPQASHDYWKKLIDDRLQQLEAQKAN